MSGFVTASEVSGWAVVTFVASDGSLRAFVTRNPADEVKWLEDEGAQEVETGGALGSFLLACEERDSILTASSRDEAASYIEGRKEEIEDEWQRLCDAQDRIVPPFTIHQAAR